MNWHYIRVLFDIFDSTYYSALNNGL